MGRRARKLTVKAYSVDDEKWTFQLSNLKIIPSPSDMEMLKMHPNVAEEEEKLLKTIMKQPVLNKIEIKAMLEEIEKKERGTINEMKEESKSLKEAMMSEINMLKEKGMINEM